MSRKNLFSLLSASMLAVLGGGLCMPLGCASADPDDAMESVNEAELAIGVGGSCNPNNSLCDAGLTCCAPDPGLLWNCRDLMTDENNCGSCNNVCATGKVCMTGLCCSSFQTHCPGGCVDLDTDEKNCGSCGNRCALGEFCVLGECN